MKKKTKALKTDSLIALNLSNEIKIESIEVNETQAANEALPPGRSSWLKSFTRRQRRLALGLITLLTGRILK